MKPGALLKILGTCCGVLILFWLGYLYFQVPHRQAPYAKAILKADAIHLKRATSSVDLKKSGSQWKLMDGNGATYPADPEKMKSLIDALKNLQLEDAISDRPERAAEFDITPEMGLRVTLMTGSRALADGIFGKQSSDYTHVYFKFPDSATIYLARGVFLGELGGTVAKDWRDHALVSIPETDMQEIEIVRGEEKTRLLRSSDTWTLNGQAVDPAPVYGLVGALAHLKADDFVVPGSTPAVTYEQLTEASVSVKSAKGDAVTLRIGAADKAGRRYPAAVDPQSLVWLSEAKAKSLVLKPSSFPPRK